MRFKKLNRKTFLVSLLCLLGITVFSLSYIIINISFNENDNPENINQAQQTITPLQEKNYDQALEANATNKAVNSKKGTQPPQAIATSSNSSIANYDFSSWNSYCGPTLIVVNKNNKIADDFNLSLSKVGDKEVSTLIKSNLENMFNDAKQDGVNLFVSSGYRSINTQKILFDRKVSEFLKKTNSKAEAETLAATHVARPYTSEHNTGLAVDLNKISNDFCKTKAYDWLIKNGAKYGFILRYNRDKTDITHVIYEPWHFRYVGPKTAKTMYEKNMCLEEYVASLIS
ncbi:MAG: hypothetical protein RUMPE_00282 [Eubacteriales bacterium SKADARSKE-1]|nr:hypothetical protein [Eubacteriales bacterium SKADARSKE-1]